MLLLVAISPFHAYLVPLFVDRGGAGTILPRSRYIYLLYYRYIYLLWRSVFRDRCGFMRSMPIRLTQSISCLFMEVSILKISFAVLFATVFVAAFGYEVFQRTRLDDITKMREKVSDIVDKYTEPNDIEESLESEV